MSARECRCEEELAEIMAHTPVIRISDCYVDGVAMDGRILLQGFMRELIAWHMRNSQPSRSSEDLKAERDALAEALMKIVEDVKTTHGCNCPPLNAPIAPCLSHRTQNKSDEALSPASSDAALRLSMNKVTTLRSPAGLRRPTPVGYLGGGVVREPRLLERREMTAERSSQTRSAASPFTLLASGTPRRGSVKESPFSHRVRFSVGRPAPP